MSDNLPLSDGATGRVIDRVAPASLDRPSGVPEVKSAARTVQLLEILATHEGEPVPLREISEQLRAPRSSTYALLQTLVRHGWVRSDVSNSFYSVGLRALLVGTTYIEGDPLTSFVRPFLDKLADQVGETIHFARLDGQDVVYLLTRETRRRPYNRVGHRLPAYATALGKALLSERTPAELDQVLPADLKPLTPWTKTDRATLIEDLQASRERGYSIDEHESTVGICCVAMSLRYDSPALDAMSCSVPAGRFTPELQDKVVSLMELLRDGIEAGGRRIHDSGVYWS